jgi:hypothetical protein
LNCGTLRFFITARKKRNIYSFSAKSALLFDRGCKKRRVGVLCIALLLCQIINNRLWRAAAKKAAQRSGYPCKTVTLAELPAR